MKILFKKHLYSGVVVVVKFEIKVDVGKTSAIIGTTTNNMGPNKNVYRLM